MILASVLVAASCSGGNDEARSTSTTNPAAEAGASPTPVRVLTLNVLHGLFCAAETDFCQAPERATMVARAVEDADCPELVGFQEIGPRQPAVLLPAMETVCRGRYELAWEGIDSPDRAMVFTTLPIIDRGFLDLAAFPWEAYWVRVDAPIGPVDFLTTHLASSANNPKCQGDGCPPACPEGITTNECNAIEVVAALDARTGGAVLQVASGDFNAEPGSPTLATFDQAGFVDAWLASGAPECDGATGRGCTAGRERPENTLDGLDVSDGRYRERIDYVLVRPGPKCTFDSAAEPFVSKPLAKPFRGLYWPSDHGGVLAELTCA